MTLIQSLIIKLTEISYLMAKSIFDKVTYQNTKSKQMRGRVDLLSQDVAKELNTYRNFGIFHTYNDIHSIKWDKDGNEIADDRPTGKPGTPGVRSIFNKFSAVITGAKEGGFSENMSQAMKDLVVSASETRLDWNIPLLDTPENRARIKSRSGCTVRELVQASQRGQFGTATYSYSDFMYCKHLGRVPNNYLITVRRYPIPVLDSVKPRGIGKKRKSTKDNGAANHAPVPIGTMVTWFGVSGNNMKDILKYKYNMSWRELNAQWEDIERQGGDSGVLNGLEAMFNPASRKAWTGGQSIPALDNMMPSFFNVGQSPYPNPYDASQQQRNSRVKVYGPIDRVKKAYSRGAEGLDWDHEFNLVFEYELKAYNGINPRQAMLDLIASILSVTYTSGGFWKGGYRGGGARQSSAFSNMNIFKCHGTFTDFMDALGQDIRTGTDAWAKKVKSAGGFVEVAKELLNMVGGMLMGGLLNKLGRPARYFAPALISDAPVGLWHITMGNPNHPIMVMGNMILLDTEIEHSGPLGLDDFPSNLKVTMHFKRGKPRDQYGIENLYMGGEDRIYTSMDKKLADMYKAAQQYKNGNAKTNMSEVPDLTVPDPDSFKQEDLTAYGRLQTMNPDDDNPVTDENYAKLISENDIKDDSDNDSNSEKKVDAGKEQDGAAQLLKEQRANLDVIHKTMSSYKELQDMWMYYFGMSDAQNAITSSRESDKGAFAEAKPEEKPKENQSEGDKAKNEASDGGSNSEGDKTKANKS